MRNLCLIIVFIYFAMPNALFAQTFSKGYLDSAKMVFRSLPANFLQFERGFVEDYSSDSSGWSYKEMTSWYNKFMKQSAIKIYKYKYDSIQKRRQEFGRAGPLLDSIILRKQDLKLIYQQALISKQFQYPPAFFPGSKIILSSKISDTVFRKKYANFDLWSFTLPCFLRNGQIAACYYIHHFFKGSGTGGLMLFRNENGHWQEFGEHVEIEF